MRRALGHPAIVAPEGRAVHAPRHRHDPGDRQRRHRLRDARPLPDRTHPDHHLPRVRRRVGGAVAVRRAGRARRHVPRPPPARAPADVRPADHRRRLRAGQARRDRDDRLRVLLPAAGRAVRRQHARQRQRARLLHRPSRRALEGARRRRCCSPCTTPSSASRSRRSPIAGSSRARRSSGCSSSRRSRRGIFVGDFRVQRRLARPRSSTCSRCRCTCAISCSSATSTARSPLSGVSNGGLLAIVIYVAVLVARVARCSLRRYRWVER